MKIDRQDTELLTAQIQIELQPEDYQDKFNQELNKQSKNLKMKGFRKGKVPKKTLLKMFGKSVLADVVFNQVNQELAQYLESEKLNILGNPLNSEDQQPIDFDPFELGAYEFKFDIGIEPQFELKGLEDGTAYPYNEVEVTDEMIGEEWESRRKRLGTQEEVEDVQEGDRVYLDSKEAEGGKVKEGGYQTEVVVLVDMVADDKVQKALMSAKVGDEVSFNPSTLEKDANPDYVRKQILQISDEETAVGDEFIGSITKVMRVVPAEVDEKFFESFGEGVSNEEDAKKEIKDQIEAFYKRQSEAIMYRSIQDTLLDLNNVDMPRGFLKRWIESQDAEAASKDNFEEEVDRFVKSLRWTLIKRKLAKMGDLTVTHGEILDHFVGQIRNYMGGYMADEAFLMQTARQLMDNEEQVSQARERIIDDKIFVFVSGKVNKDVTSVSKDEMNDIIKELNERG